MITLGWMILLTLLLQLLVRSLRLCYCINVLVGANRFEFFANHTFIYSALNVAVLSTRAYTHAWIFVSSCVPFNQAFRCSSGMGICRHNCRSRRRSRQCRIVRLSRPSQQFALRPSPKRCSPPPQPQPHRCLVKPSSFQRIGQRRLSRRQPGHFAQWGKKARRGPLVVDDAEFFDFRFRHRLNFSLSRTKDGVVCSAK